MQTLSTQSPPRTSRASLLLAMLLILGGAAPLVVRAFEMDRGSFLLSGVVGVRPLGIIAVVIGIPFAMRSKASWLTFIGVVAIAANLFWSMPALTRPGAVAAPPGTDLSVMSINLLYSATDVLPVADALAIEPPDVLLLVELTHGHMRDLGETLDDLYEYSEVAPANDVSGIGLWSKHPIQTSSIDVMVNGGWPSVRAVIDVADKQIRVVGIHPPPPGNTIHRHIQQSELAVVSRMQGDLPTIVLGDFNASEEHAVMRDFLAASHLRDAHTEAGPLHAGTWPTHLTGPALLHIDHILVSDDFVVEQATIPTFEWGGDHHPVAARLTMPYQ